MPIPESPAFYLAAPFFNPVQLKLVQEIEQIFMEQQVRLISPRLQDENKKPGPLSAEDAAVIYRRNIQGLHSADYVLAVVDWLLPTSQEIRVVNFHRGEGECEEIKSVSGLASGPLNIPDAGTVYEMGYAAALLQSRIGCQGYVAGTPKTLLFVPKPRKLNLMLTQGVSGFIQGFRHLEKFLSFGKLNFGTVPTKWTGGNI